jgi:hypothetical protein
MMDLMALLAASEISFLMSPLNASTMMSYSHEKMEPWTVMSKSSILTLIDATVSTTFPPTMATLTVASTAVPPPAVASSDPEPSGTWGQLSSL